MTNRFPVAAARASLPSESNQAVNLFATMPEGKILCPFSVAGLSPIFHLAAIVGGWRMLPTRKAHYGGPAATVRSQFSLHSLPSESWCRSGPQTVGGLLFLASNTGNWLRISLFPWRAA